ncbi:MAG TPA: ATP synthase subunit I [Pyrinomonadaceae bacterium]|nr:ATP synthase subunit I [Pyrinomonadaceae bacterium]
MTKIENNVGKSLFAEIREAGISGRIFRSMAVATSLATLSAALFAPWRVTTGLLLGGILALFNHHWLSGSATAALSVAAHGVKPKIGLAQYVLRYAVIAAVVLVAYQLNLVSLAATIFGLCSFVVALFVEAAREFYYAVIHREEIS